MNIKHTNIEFSLGELKTRQFATIGDVPSSGKDAEIQEIIEFAFGTHETERLVGCLFHYSLLETERLFLTIEVSCDFKISEFSWSLLQEKEGASVRVSKNFAQHLAGITVGTTRGILHAKTENTPFNKYPVGLLDLHNIFTEDVIIEPLPKTSPD